MNFDKAWAVLEARLIELIGNSVIAASEEQGQERQVRPLVTEAKARCMAAARDLALESFDVGVSLKHRSQVCPEVVGCVTCQQLRAERARIAAKGGE